MRLSLIAVLLCGGMVLSSRQAPPAAVLVTPKENPGPQDPRLAKLRELVAASEKALEGGDEDAAAARVDEAEVLTADWPEELLKGLEAQNLLQRLKGVSDQLGEDESDMGLKAEDEVVSLSGSELMSELARVKAGEQGITYDFPIDLNDKVATWVNLFTTTKKGFMEGALSRASRYLPMVRQVFAEEGVPEDLAYLAVIESGYKNDARSYAKAVGMWQFMRSTGRIFGLKGTAWVEERRDPVKATRAAARYLRRLHEISGDWYLALVGYNAGPLTTERAILNVGSRNFWDLHRSRWLRTQTKNYIPEMCAAVLVGRSPEKYGLVVPQLPPYVYESVQVEKATSLSVIARLSGTDVSTLKDLNPELLRGSTPPGSYPLRVPPGKAMQVNRVLAGLKGSQRLDFKTYVIRKGDTPAKVARRFRVGEQDLLEANDLSAKQFKPGKRIQVPPPPVQRVDEKDLLKRPALEDRPLQTLPPIPSAETPSRPTPDAPVAAPPEAPERPASHVVRKGETLFSIARQYGVSVEELRSWNRLKGNKVQLGARLRLHPR
ncbi:MAG TPA: LysM peptidoglycan-binding domain-containing protein [Holophagaceae bacterium]|nr:LysM peptidoglycan-binding domain-containing protein [Holophagaceae bacterium]